MVYLKCCISRVTDLDDDDDDKTNEERLFHNPIYDDTHTSIIQPHETKPTLGPTGSLINDENFPETTYDCINLPAQPAADNGQTYDVLNRSQANGMCNCKDQQSRSMAHAQLLGISS